LVTDLESWRSSAAPGDHAEYHRGFLTNDRLRSVEVNRVGNDAWSLYERGRAILTQRRVRAGTYEYLITACETNTVRRKV
jgi:hypothetical protein